MEFNHILTSIVGAHHNNQDAFKYFEDDNRIIAVVADGLGSKLKSAIGVRLICRLIVDELKLINLPLEPDKLKSPTNWYDLLSQKNANHEDYCTTCSFAVIDKNTKQISLGQIGDSPLFVSIDNNPVIALRQEKDFSNITKCLGEETIQYFKIDNFSYLSSVRVMVTSDGIGDELCDSSLDALFFYLSDTYGKFTSKSRSRKFTKEIKATIGTINNDDKSAIYIWSL